MSGTTGYTPWQNTILIFINTANPQWGKSLAKTIGHEFNHAVFFRRNKCESLLDSILFEGLAENFREQTIGGNQSPWTKIFDLKQAEELFLRMRATGALASTDAKVRNLLFFGGEDYARWTGYTMGYHIVGSFLKNNPRLSWEEIMMKQPQDIFKASSFANL